MTVSSQLSVIVVGAGLGGLTTAIELVRKGTKVKLFDSISELTDRGDIFLVGSSATRIISKWGSVLEQLEAISAKPPILRLRDSTGNVLFEQPMPADFGGFPNIFVHRGQTMKLIYEYAVSIGVEFFFGVKVTDYFETPNSAGILVGGRKYIADAVIAGDGVHSRARAFVTNKSDGARKSGFAVYRSCFPVERLRGNPLTQWIADSKTDLMEAWIGDDVHANMNMNYKVQDVTCFVTHKDDTDEEESWNLPGKVEDMLAHVTTWDPQLQAIINAIPPDVLVDWKLFWRNPLMEWISPEGRVALIGDAAHPHLASSGTGATQAVEDGTTIGALLDLSTTKTVPLGLRAFEKLRFERTSLTQRKGWETRHRWQQTDWAAVKRNPETLNFPQPEWLNGANAEKYAYDNYDAVMAHLLKGTPFKSTNIPENYVHEDWTVESMMEWEKGALGDDFYKAK